MALKHELSQFGFKSVIGHAFDWHVLATPSEAVFTCGRNMAEVKYLIMCVYGLRYLVCLKNFFSTIDFHQIKTPKTPAVRQRMKRCMLVYVNYIFSSHFVEKQQLITKHGIIVCFCCVKQGGQHSPSAGKIWRMTKENNTNKLVNIWMPTILDHHTTTLE